MGIADQTSVKTNRNYGWMLLFSVALLQSISGAFLLLFSGPEVFENDTGVAWAELLNVYPTIAEQFSMTQQSSLVTSLAVGLFSLAITYFAFKEGSVGHGIRCGCFQRAWPRELSRWHKPKTRRDSRCWGECSSYWRLPDCLARGGYSSPAKSNFNKRKS